jgi:hypothetical protein
VSAERFVYLFRLLGGDVFLDDGGRVVLDGPTWLVEPGRRHLEAIGKPAVVAWLEYEMELAERRVAARRARMAVTA